MGGSGQNRTFLARPATARKLILVGLALLLGSGGMLIPAVASEMIDDDASGGDSAATSISGSAADGALEVPFRWDRAAYRRSLWERDKSALYYENGRIPRSRLCLVSVGYDSFLRCDAGAAFEEMLDQMRLEGVQIDELNSAYRSVYEQAAVRRLVGRRRATEPGFSWHGWGLAIDVPNGDMQDWIRANGAEYGWKSNTVPREPWHFLYVTNELVTIGAY